MSRSIQCFQSADLCSPFNSCSTVCLQVFCWRVETNLEDSDKHIICQIVAELLSWVAWGLFPVQSIINKVCWKFIFEIAIEVGRKLQSRQIRRNVSLSWWVTLVFRSCSSKLWPEMPLFYLTAFCTSNFGSSVLNSKIPWSSSLRRKVYNNITVLIFELRKIQGIAKSKDAKIFQLH